MNVVRRALFAMLFWPVAAWTVVPESGLWWNPAEPGRGYGIEVQDDVVFVTYYGYQQAGGMSAFYESAGTLNPSTGVVNAYWASAANGQCFGCQWRAPQLTSIGQARFEFSSPRSGRVILTGAGGTMTIPIRRQQFVDNLPRDAMFGTWHLTEGALGIYFGESLWINRAESSPVGGFSGRRIDGSAQRILLGAPHPSLSNTMTILVDSSTSYYTFYAFEWSFNRWGGRSWTYLKTGQLSGAGLPFFGSRILGRNLSAAIAADQEFYLEDQAPDSAAEVRDAIRALGNL